ncbi:hypothetical protein AGMMS49991_03980 [Spirochaetia bacterium]|nr:hypothetical protein AGMMS49991_03980 [Spirochaetia bacterium]
MSNENEVPNPEAQAPLHSLIPLEDFKLLLGIDDREDIISRFCLITATWTIEEYCTRRLFLKKHFERIETLGDLLLPLREYPVREVLAVYALGGFNETGELIAPELYRTIPDLKDETGEEPENMIYTLALSPALNGGRGIRTVKAVYRAGYGCGEAPPDLASACLELAAWNMSRYRGRRIGIVGNVRGAGFVARGGVDGEHLEASMPENVRCLLEPYRRRTI